MTAQDELILNHPGTVAITICEGILFFIWVLWGTKKLRQKHGKPFNKLPSFCIAFFSWIIHIILFCFIVFIGTGGIGYAHPKITAWLLIWWAYSNLREKYLRNCFSATGTPEERMFFSNILGITPSMSKDEIIKCYVAKKKTALNSEELQNIELAYTFFIEPKKYGKLVKNKNIPNFDTINTDNQNSPSKTDSSKQITSTSAIPKRSSDIQHTIITDKTAETSTIPLVSSIESSDNILSIKAENGNDKNQEELSPQINKTKNILEKSINHQKENNNISFNNTIFIIIICVLIAGVLLFVSISDINNKNQKTERSSEIEKLEDVVLLAEEHINDKYTTPLAKKTISEKLERIISDQQLTEIQKIERIKKDIIKENNDKTQDSVSEYINKYKNNPVSTEDEATLLCNKGKTLRDEHNYEQAFTCFKKAAEMGNARAQAHLGECYLYEMGTKQDIKEGISWLNKSVLQNDSFGQRLLAFSYETGLFVQQDLKKSFDLYKQSANQGDIDAIRSLGDYYHDGICIPQDYEKAFECYQKAANMGDSFALCDLGECYLNGKGIIKNEAEAFRLFKLSTEKGNPKGYYHLGKCYYSGIATPINYSEAFYCFKTSANKHYFPAFDWLGVCYANGQGVSSDDKLAFSWFMKAAKYENAGGEFHVGLSYYFGQGVEKDEQAGIKWIKLAAKHGEKNAIKMLSSLNISYE